MEEIKKDLENLVRSVVEKEGCELVDFTLKGSRQARILQCFVGADRDVSVDHCVALSKKLSDVLDLHEEVLELGNYRLEVSSPGMERPLQTEQDFRRKIGREITIRHRSPEASESVEGMLLDVSEGIVTIQDQDRSVRIELSSIEEAKLRYPF